MKTPPARSRLAFALLAPAAIGACASPWAPAPPTRGETLAIIDGRAVREPDLAPTTRELAGGAALEELVLTLTLERACRERGIAVSPVDIEYERESLLDALVTGAGVRPDDPVRALDLVRAGRGLGPRRFDALLRRNAMLRALVGDTGEPTPEEIERAFEIRHGERRRLLVLVAASASEAGAALTAARARAGDTDPAAAFAEALTKHPEARAYDVGSMSVLDPDVAPDLRRAVAQTGVGTFTPVVAFDDGWGFALVESVIPPDENVTDADRAQAAAALRQRSQREAMDRLANQFVRAADVTVLDPGLAWSYRSQTERAR